MKKEAQFIQDLKLLIIRFFLLFCVVVLINELVKYFLVEGRGAYVLKLHFRLVFIGAVPIITGFMTAVLLRYKKHLLLEFINSILIVINASVIIGGIVIIFLDCFATLLPLFSFLYLGLGLYVFIKTINITQGTAIYKKTPMQIINSEILDDNFTSDSHHI